MEADYIYTSGVAGETFFRALRDEGRLLAVRCPTCDLNYLPPRPFCERCFSELKEWVDVPTVGKVAAATTAHLDRSGHPLPEPQTWALVTFPGIHGGLVHRLLAKPKDARPGRSVRARLRPRSERTGTIVDIEGFELAPK